MRLRIFLFLIVAMCSSWGFKAHRKINQLAIQFIPNKELYTFLKKESAFISEHAVDADIRKFSNHAEITSHFIDLDLYLKKFSKDSLKQLKRFQLEYLDSSLMKKGVLPWTIKRNYYGLIKAFKNRNKSQILRKLTDLGHYVGDAHVPLHTNSNYNGQHSGQLGIHSLWETQVPNLFLDTLIPSMESIKYCPEIMPMIWDVLFESYDESIHVLNKEKQLRDSLNGVLSNKTGPIKFTKEYKEEFMSIVNLDISERFVSSAKCSAIIWYSAWIEAGQPKLPN